MDSTSFAHVQMLNCLVQEFRIAARGSRNDLVEEDVQVVINVVGQEVKEACGT